MKAAPLIGLVLVGGAVAYAIWRISTAKAAAAPTGDTTPSPQNVQPLTLITPSGDSGNTGGASAPLPPSQGVQAPSPPQEQARADANAALAENNEQVTGFAAGEKQPIPTVPVSFLTTQTNPLTGGQQAVFQRIDGGGVPAAAAFQLGGTVGFIEQVPNGAPSGSQNVVFLSPDMQFGNHTIINGENTNGPLKPGDPGYDAAVAATRAKIAAVQSLPSAAKPATSTRSSSSGGGGGLLSFLNVKNPARAK